MVMNLIFNKKLLHQLGYYSKDNNVINISVGFIIF